MIKKNKSLVLPIIAIAQFFCTSTWFAGNAVLQDLILHFDLPETALGHISSAVQLGFIAGTFCYAALLIADRFPPSLVFFCSALLAAFSNLLVASLDSSLTALMSLRFLTGFFLAGIYPIGMKIASDYYEKGLGMALGYLVGGLVLGKAFPYLLKSFTAGLSWTTVLYLTTAFSCLGGLMMLLVPPGPYQKRMQSLKYKALFSLFTNKPLRVAAIGYFGHMWELYAFWTFVPVMLVTYNALFPQALLPVSAITFYIIAGGAIACVVAGYLSQRYGAGKTAFTALSLSACCCLVSPIAFFLPAVPFVCFLILWGLVVIADSPLFSSLVAINADIKIKGTAITVVTCIGFSITIGSIELLNYLSVHFNPQYIFMVLALGPIISLLYMASAKPKNISLDRC